MTHVLVVDDNADNIYMLRALLQGHGYAVDEARDGAEALAAARRAPPALVISDLLMPVMDGYTLLREWKADGRLRAVPFIVYTATYTEPKDERLALALGADAFVVKPAEPEPFMACVRGVLAKTARGALTPPGRPADEDGLLKEYNEVLVRKLEKRAKQLEEANRELVAEIAERKQAEERLLESRQRLALATESARIGVWAWDVGADTVVWDARMFELFGVPAGDARAAYDAWQAGVHPDDRARCADELAAAARGDGGFHTEFRVVWPGGEVRTLEAHGAVRRAADGAAPHMYGVNWDITDRKNADAALRLRDRAIQAATQGLLITDPARPDNPLVYVSPGFERMTGYSAAEAVGRNCRFLQGKDTAPETVAEMRAAVAAGRGCAVEVKNYRQDGTPFWNQLTIAPVLGPAGELTHFVGVQTDVTERRRLEEQFRQSQKMEAVGQLAGGVAHDFNNMLTIINGYCEMVLGQVGPDDPLRDALSEILRAGDRAGGLTRQLLAFSRQQVLAPKVLSLNAVVADTEKLLGRLIGEDILLVTTLGPAVGQVKADRGQLEQVLMNLAVNARDAMPTGGRLTVETQVVRLDEEYCKPFGDLAPGEYALLAVCDTGTGMDAATLARIFDPFFTTKEVGKGTGLGLATVHGIVKQSRGHVTAYSEVGHGTTFKVYLPLVPDPLAPRGGARPAAPAGTETVLLVEDDAAVRALARHVLRGCGYRIVEAADGQEAIRVAQAEPGPIHVLISDVVMPNLGGRALAERIFAARPGCKVLFMSGYTDDAVIRHGVLEAEYAFLQKPFTPSSLAQKVRDVLDAPPRANG